MATFFSVQVGIWGAQKTPIIGTLTGTVTREGVRMISLTNMSLGLSSSHAVAGNKTLRLWIDQTINTLNIYLPSSTTYLGTFGLKNVSMLVNPTANRVPVSWGTGDGFSGTFYVTFPSYPDAPQINLLSRTANSITIEYGVDSFGDGATGSVTLKSGSSTLDTTSQVGLKSFTYSGLDADTEYTLIAEAVNSYEKSQTSYIKVTTLKDVAMYGSVNNFAKPIDKIYGSLNNQTKEIAKIYGSLNGVTKRIF